MSTAGKSLLAVSETKHTFSQSNWVGGVCVCVCVCVCVLECSKSFDLYGCLYRAVQSSDINIT